MEEDFQLRTARQRYESEPRFRVLVEALVAFSVSEGSMSLTDLEQALALAKAQHQHPDPGDR